MKWTRTAALVAFTLIAPQLAPEARADISVEVQNGNRMFGTLDPVDEEETFLVTIPPQARVTIIARGKRAGRRSPVPSVTFQVQDEFGDLVPGANPTIRGRGALLRNFQTGEETGNFRIVVTAQPGNEDAGDYFLIIRWRTPARYRIFGDNFDNFPEPVFSGDEGSLVLVSVRGTGGSRPRIDSIDPEDVIDEDTFADVEVPFLENDRARGQRYRLNNLPATGTWFLGLDDVGPGDGRIVGAIIVRKPRPRKPIDVSAKALGARPDEGRDDAQGKIIGPLGANEDGDGAFEFQDPEDGPRSALSGTKLEVPEGALRNPTALIIGTAPDIDAGDDTMNVGPSVFFGPDGTQFEKDVMVTIPFNGASFEDDDFDGLRVFEQSGKKVTEVDEDSLTTDAGDPDVSGDETVTFPVSHFTSYVATNTPPPTSVRGDVTGDNVPDLIITGAGFGTSTSGRAAAAFIFPGGSGLAGLGTSATPADSTITLSDAVTGLSDFGTNVATSDMDIARNGPSNQGVQDVIVTDLTSGDTHVFFGGPSLASRTTAQSDVILASDDLAGQAVQGGDINNDGVGDVVIGARDAFPIFSQLDDSPGAVFVFGGRSSFSAPGQELIDTDNAGVRVIGGAGELDEFGTALAVGNLFGTAAPDIAVGAPRNSIDRLAPARGQVSVFSGGSTLVDQDSGTVPPPIVITGDEVGDGFGSSVAIGDINGDGRNDLAIGAPLFDGAGNDRGAIYVFLGSANLTRRLRQGSTAFADFAYFGLADDDRFGARIAIGDITGDGSAELMVGAPGVDISPGVAQTPQQNVGEVYVFLGGTGLPPSGSAGLADTVITGEVGAGHLAKILPVLDYTGDGFGDLAIVAPLLDADGEQGPDFENGRVYLFPGSATFFTSAIDGVEDAPIAITGENEQRLGDPLALPIFDVEFKK